MKKSVFYWSPCLNPVGTVVSTLNSAIALSKYSKDHDVSIINACGEWDKYLQEIKDNSINMINLNFKYFKYLPKTGFWGSRFSYIIIFLFSFFPLLFLLKKRKPNVIILHLITSLPLFLLKIFKFETQFILRISGYPKLNFLRKFFWTKVARNVKLITCPTINLKSDLEKKYIFEKEKIHYLQDAILNYDYLKKINKAIYLPAELKDKKIILSVGRLTKQKNFSFLVDEFSKFCKKNNEYILYIVGEGEQRKMLENKIKKLDLENKIFLIGYRNNVYDYMRASDLFVLSSLWEEVGFVMVEAAINSLYIISSNCPNGPTEFLNNGENGLLFKSNKEGELLNCLLKYSKFDKEKKFRDRLILKKNALKYSKFHHYLKLKTILNKLSY